MKKKNISFPEFTGYSVNSGRSINPNDLKLIYSESAMSLTSESTIKWSKMSKFKFAEFSGKSVFRKFPENYFPGKSETTKFGISNLENLN